VHNVANPPTTKSQKVIDPAQTKVGTKAAPTTNRRTTATVSVGIRLAYEWLLGLPVPVVLLVMWVVGVALLGACALLAYATIPALVGVVAGGF
jgi:hypothetical protein